MIAGLEDITSGTISIGERVVNDVAPKDRDIAMVFQSYALYPHMSVYDNMAFGLKLRKIDKKEIDRRVKEAAETLQLTTLLERKPKELSGGQRQRVALGRAIVREPDVFLMDEPLSNLDAKLRVQTRAEIARLHQRLKTTIVYVTHDQVEAMTMGQRIAVMSQAKLQQVGSPQELYDRPLNKFVAGFIGSPPMNFIPVTLEGSGESAMLKAEGIRSPWRRRSARAWRPRPPATSSSASGPSTSTSPRATATTRPPIQADVVEYLGNEELLHIILAGIRHRGGRRRGAGRPPRRCDHAPLPARQDAPLRRRHRALRAAHPRRLSPGRRAPISATSNEPGPGPGSSALRAADNARMSSPTRPSRPPERSPLQRSRPTSCSTIASPNGSSRPRSCIAAASSSSGWTPWSAPTGSGPGVTSPPIRAPWRSSPSIPRGASCRPPVPPPRRASSWRSRRGPSSSTRRRRDRGSRRSRATRAGGGDRLPGRGWERLTDFWTAPGFATERIMLYLASELRPADDDRRGPDEDEALQLVRLPWREAVAAGLRGEIGDAKSLVGLLWLARRMEGGRRAERPGRQSPGATVRLPPGVDSPARAVRAVQAAR